MDALAVPVTTLDVSVSVVAAAVFGLFVSYVATRHFRRFVADVQENSAEQSMRRFSEAVQSGSSMTEAWHSLINATAVGLDRLDVRLVSVDSGRHPVIARHRVGPDGCGDAVSTVVIPHDGALLGLGDPRMSQELLVTPRPGFGAVEVPREVLMAFADHVGLMARTGLLSELRG